MLMLSNLFARWALLSPPNVHIDVCSTFESKIQEREAAFLLLLVIFTIFDVHEQKVQGV